MKATATAKATAAVTAAAPTKLAAVAAVAAAPDPTKIPHYFGPYAKWANSPQVLSNAIVTISGGGGTGAEATATVDPKTGGVSGYTITKPGTGYTSVPDVAIAAPGSEPPAAGAAGTAVVSTGVITSIAVAEAGFGFTTPSVTITDGGSPSVVAAAQASGGVDDLTLTSGGSRYASGGSRYAIKPIIELSLPDAPYCTVAAPAVTTCAGGGDRHDDGGVVDNTVTVVTAGSGYLTAPTVTVWDGSPKTPVTVPARGQGDDRHRPH